MEQEIINKAKEAFPMVRDSIEAVNILSKLIQMEFQVTEEVAEELIDRGTEYNINSSAELLTLIEEEFGYKPRWKK